LQACNYIVGTNHSGDSFDAKICAVLLILFQMYIKQIHHNTVIIPVISNIIKIKTGFSFSSL